MSRPPPSARILLSFWFLALLFGTTSAHAEPPRRLAADAPLRQHHVPDAEAPSEDAPPQALHQVGPRRALTLRDMSSDGTSTTRALQDSPPGRVDTSLALRDASTPTPRPIDTRVALTLRADTASSDGTRLPGMSGVPISPAPEDLPLSTGAWVAHGGLALLPLGGVWGATRVGGDTRVGAITAESAAAMLVGYLPSRLLFLRPTTPGVARWMDLEVAAFTGGLVLTPPLAALGTWGLGEVAFGRSQDPSDAYLGALGGAATGTLLAAVVDGLLSKLAEPSIRLKSARYLIGLALIGTGATLGYQWAGGGPRPNQHTR